jgi:hypothetical protein
MRLLKVASLPDFCGQTPRPSPTKRRPGRLFLQLKLLAGSPVQSCRSPRSASLRPSPRTPGTSPSSPLSALHTWPGAVAAPPARPPTARRNNGEEMAVDLSRYRVGTYGAGALWCIRRQGTLLLLFNDTPIARRAKNATADKTWMALDSSWSVKSLGGAEVLVQHNGSEGVIVSLHGGNQ